ncbi:MAG: 30S ribosomal protein S20 [Puniceicoccales bacterium]|jgi:small subunit ribosomal protein S20|nr:30S ribosomal protein S20 [Puniceicoccales bacterium]
MANKKAAEKSMRQTAGRTARNRMIMSRLRTGLKRVLALAKESGEGLREAAIDYVSMLDKAAKVGVIHHNKASRHKSMMAKYIF